jgi:lysyl-tRNA synthetase class 2
MDDEGEQIAVRRRKLAEHREQVGQAYPNDFRPDTTAAALQATYGAAAEGALGAAPVVWLAGRVLAVRDFGKTAFFHLQDGSGRIQVYVKRDHAGVAALALLQGLDAGDIAGVWGKPFRTRTGELTILADGLRLLAKALRPLPDKWHGLQDVEIRYRQRYLDLLVNPEVRAIFERRARIIQGLRDFLTARGYLEVETPMMQAVAGGAAARPFVTHHNALGVDLYLRIAPELFLKRLVVGGIERVFELNRTFRNEGVSTQHNPEFTMLEFYQAYATYEDLMAMTEELLGALAARVAGGLRLRWGPHEIDLAPPWPRVTMREAVARALGLGAAEVEDEDRLRAAAAARAVPLPPEASYGEVLVEVFEKTAEAALVQPTFVVGFPVEVSPLARLSDADPAFVDRFELFVGGREIANGFSELNDPDDQRRRFEAQVRARRGGNEEAHAMDEDYVRALEHGLPPTAGEGIGIDRLVMLLTDAPSIRDVILFPLLRPERS